MQHSFDITIAEKYGVNVAIFLNNLAFWIKKNQANNKHFYDGRYWTYNSSEALTSLFPYWSTDQMDRLIKKCTSLGLVVIDNFNETTYDRRRWYGLTEKGLELFNMTIPRFRGMDSAKSNLPFREIAECIYTDTKPDIKPERAPSRKKRVPLSDNFNPDEKKIILLNRTAERVGMKAEELLEKFKMVMNSMGKSSADWQAELGIFLINERAPVKKNNSLLRAPSNEIRCTVPQVDYQKLDHVPLGNRELAMKKISEIKLNLAKKGNGIVKPLH